MASPDRDVASAQVESQALELFRLERFDVRRVGDINREEYVAFLKDHYQPLGFFCEQVLPRQNSTLFEIRHDGRLAAIFRLTEITEQGSPYFQLVPGACAEGGQRRRLLEVNNVVIAQSFRASIVLGLILYRSACEAHKGGYDFVVGMNRYQILRFFVDFGVIPADHTPIHALGKEHLLDFVNYYDTADPMSIAYMHERAKRYFHQEYVMRSIYDKYIRQRPAKVPSAQRSQIDAAAPPRGAPLAVA
jgi:hypothetical protein